MSQISQTALKLEIALLVGDLQSSIAFYSVLFQSSPLGAHPHFARFDIDDPPLMLTLSSGSKDLAGRLNHLGYRVVDPVQLVEIQQRLELAGISTCREDHVECCYSLQTKFWVTDPDGNQWEIYALDDVEEHEASPAETIEETPVVIWGHRLGSPWESPIPHEVASVDEVHLDLPEDFHGDGLTDELLKEVRRILRPGGSLALRWISDSLDEIPHVLNRLELAGFGGGQVDHLESCSTESGVQRWKIGISAVSLGAPQSAADLVMYRGPFQQVTCTGGTIIPRNRRVAVSGSVRELIRHPSLATQFTQLGLSENESSDSQPAR